MSNRQKIKVRKKKPRTKGNFRGKSMRGSKHKGISDGQMNAMYSDCGVLTLNGITTTPNN